ncbi:aspartate-semialdehyde dehydrogenase [candidate division MSBL1 archaeon SCGC-AAA261F19]|uniref:Aspartate-semialdehyde dehydrogenase n=2 Tax=candidate division MSBL1 TaxID=215777 RepID=A0A133V9S9_9EURY|nr:aspartate-semialdehyde dehydrogenase [candidate division MSBL1 archaeon SCGC-AAA261D19]KXB03189.1 aspartate-semialdehyde dehydrogenase [candidate division MSBL1 archaeon SCGC-AAA261F19]
MTKTSVAVLGATGMVGQRFVQLLANHPYFEIEAFTASKQSVGKCYKEAAKWYLHPPMPEEVKDMEVQPTEEKAVEGAEIVFSALPSNVAKKVEPVMAKAGHLVASNASSYRMESDVPLLIPEVNPEHLALLYEQHDRRGWEGSIVTNPNCTTIILVLALKPLFDDFGIERLFVSTMQALSGAGYGGVKSMEIQDNLIPYIGKEEWKTENETLKILGEFKNGEILPAKIEISSSCHRVPVLDGHTEAVFLELGKETSLEEVSESLAKFKAKPQELKLPTAPEQPIIVETDANKPQPRSARFAGSVEGMAVAVGRIRKDPILKNGIRFVVSGNNAIRGAAGASVLNAELMKSEGLLK